jgi:hypothetical protein
MSSDDSKKEFLSEKELQLIKDSKIKKSFSALLAEKYILESQKADLEFNNVILKFYIKKGLSLDDTIDESSGEIIKKEKESNGGGEPIIKYGQDDASNSHAAKSKSNPTKAKSEPSPPRVAPFVNLGRMMD